MVFPHWVIFLNAAAQLRTTVTGEGSGGSTTVLTRKRWPFAITAYLLPCLCRRQGDHAELKQRRRRAGGERGVSGDGDGHQLLALPDVEHLFSIVAPYR